MHVKMGGLSSLAPWSARVFPVGAQGKAVCALVPGSADRLDTHLKLLRVPPRASRTLGRFRFLSINGLARV